MKRIYTTRQTLLERVQDRYDNDAWDEFVEAYEAYIYAIIRRSGINETDARDIHQTVLLAIWNKLPAYKKYKGTRFRGWIATITSNSLKKFIRTQKNLLKKHDAAAESQNSYLSAIRLPDIEQIAEEEWEMFLIDQATENVGRVYSGNAMDVFHKTLDGIDANLIAEQLQISLDSVYTLRSRVKQSIIKEVQRLRTDLE